MTKQNKIEFKEDEMMFHMCFVDKHELCSNVIEAVPHAKSYVCICPCHDENQEYE